MITMLLADDDRDDCLLFNDALIELSLDVSLTIVHDGEQLMQHLKVVSTILPDLLFLDLNMPRKNGFECLSEIKNNRTLNKIPVIIYSTSYNAEKANQLFNIGAHYYICKPTDFKDLKKIIHRAIQLVKLNRDKPSQENFLISKLTTTLL